MAKNKTIENEDIRISCSACDIIAKKDEDRDIRIQTVVGSHVLSEILIPHTAIDDLISYLQSLKQTP